MQVYLVNMDRSTERLEIMSQRLATLGIAFERVAAVDGYKLADTAKKCVTAPNWRYPYYLTPGEIGCFLSHKKCWQKLVDSKDDWALVLEDDSFFHPKAKDYFQSTTWIPSGVKLIQFSFAIDDTYSDKILTLHNGCHLVRVKHSSPCGTYAYMISREAALQALTLSNKIEGPIDNFMFGMFFEFPKIISNWRLKECVVKVIDDVEPTITGRGRCNKTNSRNKINPLRLLEKVKIQFGRLKTKKIQQNWYNDNQKS